jgi:hypothetical protein
MKIAKISTSRIPTINGGYRTRYDIELKDMTPGAPSRWPYHGGYCFSREQAELQVEQLGATLVKTWREGEKLAGVGKFDGQYCEM